MERYTASAEIYDTIYAEVVDYPATGRLLKWIIQERNPEAKTVLEVACGTGAVLEQLVGEFELAGMDLSEEMLAVASAKLPGVELRQADMATFEWGSTFDVVLCMFSSIGYMTDLAGLEAAYEHMVAHLNPGGVLVSEAWLRPDVFQLDFVHPFQDHL